MFPEEQWSERSPRLLRVINSNKTLRPPSSSSVCFSEKALIYNHVITLVCTWMLVLRCQRKTNIAMRLVASADAETPSLWLFICLPPVCLPAFQPELGAGWQQGLIPLWLPPLLLMPCFSPLGSCRVRDAHCVVLPSPWPGVRSEATHSFSSLAARPGLFCWQRTAADDCRSQPPSCAELGLEIRNS